MRRRPRRQGWDCGSERLAKDHKELAEVRALAELFLTRVRYGGFSVPHNVADAIMEEREPSPLPQTDGPGPKASPGREAGLWGDRSIAREIHD